MQEWNTTGKPRKNISKARDIETFQTISSYELACRTFYPSAQSSYKPENVKKKEMLYDKCRHEIMPSILISCSFSSEESGNTM